MEVLMLNQNIKQNNILEKFRIKAHLRSFVKDPIIVQETLLSEAAQQLKKLPYEDRDPSGIVATELVLEAYRLGYFKYKDLTDTGCKLVSQSKFRGHHQLPDNRTFNAQIPRNHYTFKAI